MGQRTGRPPRVVVIGLDLGDGRLVRGWASEGRLPNLAALMRRGGVMELGTTAESLHVSAWPTLYTGAEPGHHGVYYTFQPAPGHQGYRRFREDQYGAPTLWRLLGDAGVRCTVFDAPYTHPEPGPGVVQVFDWGTWAHYWRPSSTPRSLLRDLNRHAGRYPLGLEAHDLGLAAQDAAGLQPRLIEAAHAKTEAVLWLMDRSPGGLFLTVYGETHPGAHYCWWPAHDGSADRDDLGLLEGLYREIDDGIGRIVARLPEDATVIIVSGDSVGPNRSGWHLLPDVLRRLGVLAEPGAPTDEGVSRRDVEGQEGAGVARAGWDPVTALRNRLPKDFRKALARRLPTALRDRLARRVDTSSIDWSRTLAFTLPTDLEGCVRINVVGREPLGVVEPGPPYERVCDDVAQALLELVNPETGGPAVRDVIRVDRRFPGARRDFLPDLIALWSSVAPIRELRSSRIGVVSGASPDGRTGTHAPPGFLIVRSPAIVPGSPCRGADVRDLAPTVLALFGVERPEHMRGASLVPSPVPSNVTGDG